MSQPSNDGFVQLIATGGETSLAWDFKIGQYTDIKITRTRAGVKVTLALNTDYTIAANQLNQSNGGVANLIGTALPALAGDIYTLLLDTPSQRTSDFSQQGAFQAATVNAELDNLVRMTQRLTRDVSKALKYDETLNIPNSVITESIDENFTIVGGATSGSFKEGPSVGDISNAAANATAAAASAATASAAAAAAQAANGGTGRVARLATAGNVTLSGLQTIDGVVGAAGDRIFVRGQTNSAENGIYIMASGAWARASDANTWSSFVGMLCTITEGSARKNHVYISLVTQGGTLGTTPITFDTVPIDGHVGTTKIADNAVTPTKMSQSTAFTVLGNNTNATANKQDISKADLYPQSFQVGGTVAANALTATLQPTPITFRSATAGSGSITNLMVSTALSLTVPSGATLGTTNGVAATLALAAINNAGTVEYAINNVTSLGSLASEGIITTTALSASSNSANTWYSTTARTGVPYKLVGILTSTQATAGTYATAPSSIQGYGIAHQGLTVINPLTVANPGAVWTNPARTSGTTYTNTTGNYRLVYVNMNATSGSTIVVGGVTIHNQTNGQYMPVSFLVPPGLTYVVTAATGISNWAELG